MGPTEQPTPWLALPWDGIVAHFAELGLKGANRGWFTTMQRRNLSRALRGLAARVVNRYDHLSIQPVPGRFAEAFAATVRVIGVAYAQPVRQVTPTEPALVEAGLALFRAIAGENASFAVRAENASRILPYDSLELARRVGGAIKQATGAPVDLEHPDVTIGFRVYGNAIWLLGPRLAGPGGLPLGAHGPVLTLFSGGIDSPVAAWQMMRRGCLTDFLHVYSQPSPEQVRDTKIVPLLRRILDPQQQKARLFLVPYDTFQAALLQVAVRPELELILFRRFLARVADRLATEHGFPALVTGDNLGQVASQTLENLVAMGEVATRPVLRPLLTYDKQQIITQARQLGTYDLSIQPYKDCCSLVARHPATRPKPEAILIAESRLPIDDIVARALRDLVVWNIDPGATPSA